MLHCCQAAGCVKECCKRYKMCKHSDTHMTGNEGCWLVLVPFITSIWIHVYETKHQFFFHVLACVCVLHSVKVTQVCIFFLYIIPMYQKTKKTKQTHIFACCYVVMGGWGDWICIISLLSCPNFQWFCSLHYLLSPSVTYTGLVWK